MQYPGVRSTYTSAPFPGSNLPRITSSSSVLNGRGIFPVASLISAVFHSVNLSGPRLVTRRCAGPARHWVLASPATMHMYVVYARFGGKACCFPCYSEVQVAHLLRSPGEQGRGW
jgi:hypothetical protein